MLELNSKYNISKVRPRNEEDIPDNIKKIRLNQNTEGYSWPIAMKTFLFLEPKKGYTMVYCRNFFKQLD